MTAEEQDDLKRDVSNGLRLEKASVGVSAIGGLLLIVLLGLVSDVRGSITTLVVKVDQAIRDVAILQAQGLDARLRMLEGTATRNIQKIEYLERECERLQKGMAR